MAMPKPYSDNNPYSRRFKKRSELPNDDTATEDDSAETNPNSNSKAKEPLAASSFSADAIKRRLKKDKYNV